MANETEKRVLISFRVIGATMSERKFFVENFSKPEFDFAVRTTHEKGCVLSMDVSTETRLNAVREASRAQGLRGERCDLFLSLRSELDSDIIDLPGKWIEFIAELKGSVKFSYTMIFE